MRRYNAPSDPEIAVIMPEMAIQSINPVETSSCMPVTRAVECSNTSMGPTVHTRKVVILEFIFCVLIRTVFSSR